MNTITPNEAAERLVSDFVPEAEVRDLVLAAAAAGAS